MRAAVASRKTTDVWERRHKESTFPDIQHRYCFLLLLCRHLFGCQMAEWLKRVARVVTAKLPHGKQLLSSCTLLSAGFKSPWQKGDLRPVHAILAAPYLLPCRTPPPRTKLPSVKRLQQQIQFGGLECHQRVSWWMVDESQLTRNSWSCSFGTGLVGAVPVGSGGAWCDPCTLWPKTEFGHGSPRPARPACGQMPHSSR